MSKAAGNGVRAYWEGIQRNKNPNTEQADINEWLDGWDAAAQEDSEKDYNGGDL